TARSTEPTWPRTVTPSLFLSGADAPLNGALMSQKGITLIVNATLSHALPAHPGVECLRVPVCDLPCQPLGLHFDRVAERIHGNRAGGTLVHCAAGRSRSPALVMAYLMRFRGATLRQAHRRVLESRPCIRINAGFWEQLLQYERRLYGRNTVRVEPEGAGPLGTDQKQTAPFLFNHDATGDLVLTRFSLRCPSSEPATGRAR
uniref:Si:ch1073-184j22.2 n=1 Tax=Poecilia reticulata TaxID=8081 RepID=A0A3P9MWF1_POERE